MKNKTCGECKFYQKRQRFWCLAVAPEHEACEEFEPEEVKMKTKTCGECKIARPSGRQGWMYCHRKHDTILSEAEQCQTPYITIGDNIRQMSDEELAEKFVYSLAYDVNYEEWYSTLFPDTICFSNKQKALEATLKELQKEYKKKNE